ncbi:hypothetical protein WH50_22495 [Pokkaliibacter plantistimulans]|uniref:Novel STAND NTPase 5 domain-containing protein n=1 Tax=Pokkaliibacter plantistimulans TaxID=1635171 RepID=A0ABX5LU57_9GAMM|nr:SIR2 family protein [Pokkaliibacter plantistimulans]PXF29135.1 hypothetical protein WH50_22495 [Pokkaliibacter plantistimulans]
MDIPSTLLDKIERGRVILFLGSGALVGSSLKQHEVPLGDHLGQLISRRFLNDEYRNESLIQISELAMSEYGMFDVQEFIREIFEDIQPASFHHSIPEFHWKAIFTTNYDRLIETCYTQHPAPLQKLSVHISDDDHFSEGESTNDRLGLIKLHGCITRTKDNKIPLILTVEQYNEYNNNRKNLFKYLYEMALEYTIVFIGHSLQDANIRHIISLLHREVPNGQRHYLIKPGLRDAEINLWSSKKISAINATFEDFIKEIKEKISLARRSSYLVIPTQNHAIQSIFITNIPPSAELIRFLTNQVEYLKGDINYSQCKASDFYRGSDLGWYPIAEELTTPRSMIERFFEETILKPESERQSKIDLVLLKGEAGAGKTTFLRQIAWRVKDVGFGCALWAKNIDHTNIDIIKEINEKSNERIFIFWDDAALNTHKIASFLTNALKARIPLTIFTAERYNEWNLRCDNLKKYVTATYTLNNLSTTEIVDLLSKLEKHNCLGPNLQNKSHQQRVTEFTVSFERQLLVALHEATMGEPFEDIIFNEYSSIEPIHARAIYRTICTLNRLRVPVRAGLIARIFDINFEKFKEDFFEPLEKVVLWEESSIDDIHYKARHPEIAEIVFNRSFSTSLDRYNEYIQILSKINISYESDRSSYRQLMRAKSLHDVFPDYEDVSNIYRYAIETLGRDGYLLQQIANFERIRPNGNLALAIELLEEAKEISPNDSSIYHSLATVWRDRASSNAEHYARIKFRREASSILEEIKSRWDENAYTAGSIIELAIDNFSDLLLDTNLSEKIIDDSIIKIEEEINSSRQKFPDDSHISTLEARFASLLNDNQRVAQALSRAFDEYNRDPSLAIRLSKIHVENGKISDAISVLKSAIERRRGHLRLNFQYAETLRLHSQEQASTVAYYYRRSFNPDDKNYQAQFWFARYSFDSPNSNEKALSRKIFTFLRAQHLPLEEKNKIRDYEGGIEIPKIFSGTVKSLSTGYGFISIDGSGEGIFFPRNQIENNLWDATKVNDRMKFNLGFSYNGPLCCNICPY